MLMADRRDVEATTHSPDKARFHGRLLALMAPVFWSISGVTVRYMESASAWQINFYRSGSLTLFVLAVLLVRYRGGVVTAVRATGWAGPVGGFFLGMAFLANIVALTHTTVANAVLLMGSGPIVAAILARIFLAERIGTATLFAIVLAALAIAIMVGGGTGSGQLFGDIVALAGVMAFGCYVTVLRGGAAVDMTPAVFYAGIFSTIASALVSVPGEGLAVSWLDFALCTMLGFVQLGIGSVMFAWAAQSVPAVELALFSLGETVLAPIWTWVGVGEVPHTATFVGGAVMLLALIIQATRRETLPRD